MSRRHRLVGASLLLGLLGGSVGSGLSRAVLVLIDGVMLRSSLTLRTVQLDAIWRRISSLPAVYGELAWRF
jgi:hypothetical protein